MSIVSQAVPACNHGASLSTLIPEFVEQGWTDLTPAYEVS